MLLVMAVGEEECRCAFPAAAAAASTSAAAVVFAATAAASRTHRNMQPVLELLSKPPHANWEIATTCQLGNSHHTPTGKYAAGARAALKATTCQQGFSPGWWEPASRLVVSGNRWVVAIPTRRLGPPRDGRMLIWRLRSRYRWVSHLAVWSRLKPPSSTIPPG
eukprot:336105-Chlamydomonas_euryale.AAC.1